MVMKYILIQLINLYEVANFVLQDIENYLTFAKLKVLHPSIIKMSDLYKQLTLLQKYSNSEKLPLPVTLDNTSIFENI